MGKYYLAQIWLTQRMTTPLVALIWFARVGLCMGQHHITQTTTGSVVECHLNKTAIISCVSIDHVNVQIRIFFKIVDRANLTGVTPNFFFLFQVRTGPARNCQMFVVGLWEEAGIPRAGSHKHKKKIQTSHTKTLGPFLYLLVVRQQYFFICSSVTRIILTVLSTAKTSSDWYQVNFIPIICGCKSLTVCVSLKTICREV